MTNNGVTPSSLQIFKFSTFLFPVMHSALILGFEILVWGWGGFISKTAPVLQIFKMYFFLFCYTLPFVWGSGELFCVHISGWGIPEFANGKSVYMNLGSEDYNVQKYIVQL